MPSMADLRRYSWPSSKLTEGLSALASAAGLDPSPTANVPTSLLTDSPGRLIEGVAAALSIRAGRVRCDQKDLDDFLRFSAPSVIRLPESENGEFLLLLGSGRDVIWVLGQDLGRHSVRRAEVTAAFRRRSEGELADSISQLLNGANLNGARRSRSRNSVLREQVPEKYNALWTLRRRGTVNLRQLAQQSRLGRYLAVFLICYLAQYALLLASWWLIGAAALRGYIDFGLLQAWGLLLLTRIPLVALSSWYQGVVAARAGSVLKQRLLEGTFRLAPEVVRREGVGHTLSRVMESEALETLALGGGFLALVAGMELLAAAVVLGLGANAALQVSALVAWLVVAGFRGADFWRHRSRWTTFRLGLTRSSTELMIGHRTRLAQRSGDFEAAAEDKALTEYFRSSEAMDRSAAKLQAVVPRGWLLVGMLLLAPGFVTATSSTAGLAVGIGGILLAYRALERAVAGFTLLVDAFVAWREAAALFRAGGQDDATGDSFSAVTGPTEPSISRHVSGERRPHFLEAHGVEFAYAGGARHVVRDCSFRIDAGDRVLLESVSSAGSSALISLIGGLRRQSGGLLLLDGLDRGTLQEDAWARLVATVAQPHENHVFANTLAFNLLMGRRWPPEPGDLEEAEAVCCQLGLGPLLQRMPGGLHQVVGDTGWQLSQGERARLFIGRALLQGSRLVIIDAALASLDADALGQVVNCVAERAPSVLVTTLVGDDRP